MTSYFFYCMNEESTMHAIMWYVSIWICNFFCFVLIFRWCALLHDDTMLFCLKVFYYFFRYFFMDVIFSTICNYLSCGTFEFPHSSFKFSSGSIFLVKMDSVICLSIVSFWQDEIIRNLILCLFSSWFSEICFWKIKCSSSP